MASTYPLSVIEALDAESTGTRVVFEWHEDRYRHAIYGVHRGQSILLAESVEGDKIDPWPPSPPLQQLHKQTLPTGGEVLFLTGMAGKSHWSGSVSTMGDHVVCEFACRYTVRPEWLGVTYRLARDIQAEIRDDRAAVVLKTGNSLELMFRSTAVPVSIATETVLTSWVTLTAKILEIAAIETPHLTAAATNRWSYAVQLSQPQGMTGNK